MISTRRQAIERLLALGCPPLPVAPAQDPRKPYCHQQSYVVERFKPKPRRPEIQGDYCRVSYTAVGDGRAPVQGDYCRLDENLNPIARFTGKNPSWLDERGRAHSLNHKDFQNRLPTEAELAKWFANPANGVGTLGGHNGIDWLDFDAKNYSNQEDCDRDVAAVRAKVGPTWVERTGSGGYRIAVKPEQAPTFTNFTTDPSGEGHIGEALWAGRFTVLAPTIHPNGNPYRVVEAAPVAAVQSLESIGIYPTKDEQANQQRTVKRVGGATRVAVASDPSTNPWDMRNLADYLEGTHDRGDYIRCKCPAHQGTSDDSLFIHRDSGAFRCWSGCDNSRILNETKQAAIAAGYRPTAATAPAPAPAAAPFDLDTWRQRKQAQQVQERAQWFSDMAKLSGAPAGADRAAIAAAFDKQHKLSGPVEVGTFGELALPMAGQRSLVLLDGQKMTRKTSSALRSVVAQALAQGIAGVIYVPTRVLARALVAELRRLVPEFDQAILTVDQWQALNESEDEAPPAACWVVSCPESAYKLAKVEPRIICFDEANESIPRVQSGQLGLYPAESRTTIKRQLAYADMVVLAQEGLYRPTVAAVQRWGQFDPSQGEVIRRRRVPTNMTINLYIQHPSEPTEKWDGLRKDSSKGTANTAFYTWFDKAAKAQGQYPIIMPSGAEGKARVCDRVLKAEYPAIKSQVLDGRYTPSKVRRDFADNPARFAQSRDLGRVPFSPTFDSGVSIEGTYFGAQFEYIRAFEPSSNASQRGERYRDAIKGKRLRERNIYISTHGLPSMPPVEVFTADYWSDLLGKREQTEAISLAKQMGCDSLIERLDRDNPDDWRELPEFMAIAARETFFKVELLTQEWEGNGWQVVEAELDDKAPGKWSDKFYQVRQGIIEQQSRILKKSSGQALDEISGAISAAKAFKWQLGEMLGENAGATPKASDYNLLKDAEFIEAWVIASGDRSLSQLQVRALVKMAHENPQQWAELSRQFALNTLAYGLINDLPSLPCSVAVFEQARLLKDAPGLYPAIAGTLGQWTNKGIAPRDAGVWARHQAKSLARFSQHNQRINGLQFTGKTPDVKCFHKLLSMVGLDGHCTGRQSSGARLWEYRLKNADDVKAALKAASTGDRPHEVQREAYRLKTDSEVYSTLERVLKGRIDTGAAKWSEVADQLKQDPSRTSVGKESTTEVLDKVNLIPGTLVRKTTAIGWRGPVVGLKDHRTALVQWFGDECPSAVPLSSLEVAA